MKRIVFLFASILVSLLSFADPDPNVGKYFQFTENLQLNNCDAIGQTTGGNEIIMSGVQFTIVASTTTDYVIFIFHGHQKDATFNAKYFNTTSTAALLPDKPDIYFLLSRATFTSKCKPRLQKNSFTVGLVNLPLKIRFGNKKKTDGLYNKDFLLSSDVSLGLSMGYKRKWSEDWGINFLGGLSLSSIQVDSSITKGFIKSATNATAITGHVGVLFEVNNFQFGIFTGIDFLTGQTGKQFLYKKDPWLGIAIGYSLFKGRNTRDTQL